MISSIIPKLPMRNAALTKAFYIDILGFHLLGEYPNYLLLERDGCEIHFFTHEQLDPLNNDGQLYIRVTSIDQLFHSWIERGATPHPNGHLATKPWGQREFALLDPDHNLLTFGEGI